VTGLATDDRIDKVIAKEEEVVHQLSELISDQVKFESKLTNSVGELQRQEERNQASISEERELSARRQSAVGRLFVYQELLSEDEELLADILTAMREGAVPIRLDSYLSGRSGLSTLGGFQYVGIKMAPKGAEVRYLSRVFRDVVPVSDLHHHTGLRLLTTDSHSYLLLPTSSHLTELTEYEVSCSLF
jgi:hypothetical protein